MSAFVSLLSSYFQTKFKLSLSLSTPTLLSESNGVRNHFLTFIITTFSKLRMKLMGHRRKDGDSKTNSPRTSPSKVEDTEFVNHNLLASNSAISDEEVSSMGISSIAVKPHQFQKMDGSNSSSVHPTRSLEEDNLDYDSNASSSSFEFHKHDRSSHISISRSLFRPMSSKWNDAEKWIINKQHTQTHNLKDTMLNRVNSGSVGSGIRSYCSESITPQSGSLPHPVSCQTSEETRSTDQCPESKDLKETSTHEETSVSMRDMGTEMTPIPSQEPSVISTPVGAATPLRSPNSSVPSTPARTGLSSSTPIQHKVNDNSQSPKDLSDQEVKLRTRKEILQLGVQLGKMNIAAWASKEDMEKNRSNVENETLAEESLRAEFDKQAAAWEHAEKSKHNAKFMREEIKIQAWENQQKVKLEAKMRRIEAEAEQKRAGAQAKMLKKIAMAKQKSEARRATAETAMSRQVARAAARAEYIRRTGRVPPSSPLSCCGWS